MVKEGSCQFKQDQMSLTEVMLELVRAAVLDQDPVLPENTKVDWDKLMDISQEQGVIAWVYDGICKLPVEQQPPRIYRINWGMSAQEIWDRYKLQKSALNDIVSICDHNQIRIMLMKGIGLSGLFPKPESRPSGDIDVYLFDDFEKGNKLFSAKVDQETELHTSFIYKGVEIENHKIFVYHNTKVKGLVGDYLLRHTSDAIITSDGYYTFAPLPNLVYLLMHALNHVNYASEDTIFSLKHILDIGMFIQKNRNQLIPEEVLRTMRELLLDKSFELMVYLSEWLYRVELREYHQNLIERNDLQKIGVLFNKQGLSAPLEHYPSLIKQAHAIHRRYNTLKPIAKYIPKKPKCSLRQITWYLQKLYFVRRLFKLPDGESTSLALKNKFSRRRRVVVN